MSSSGIKRRPHIRYHDVNPTYISFTVVPSVSRLAVTVASEGGNGNTSSTIHANIGRQTADVSGRLTAVTSIYCVTNVVAVTFEAIRECNGVLTARIIHTETRRASIYVVRFAMYAREY